MTTYTLVTVVHRVDYPLLRLQARSLSRYLRLGAADEIWVIANQGLRGTTDWQEFLLRDYGPLANRVRLLDSSEVAAVGEATRGWVSQQILKLMVASLVTTDRYVVLDAKNHVVFPLRFEFFEVGAKLRSSRTNFEGNAMRPYLTGALRYFGVAESSVVSSFLPTITPFVFPTQLARTFVDTVAEREQCAFATAFGRLRTTEFLLFGGYLCSQPGGIERVYDLTGRGYPVIWRRTANQGFRGVEPVVARVEAERLPFFTVHRPAFALLDVPSRESVAALWTRRHLFDSVEAGLRFLASI